MSGTRKAKVYIGTSGYNYPHWGKGIFYPKDLPRRVWLQYYVQYFDTVELNVSFYRLPSKEIFKGWHRRTPRGFIFVVKGSRFITHIKRLKDCRQPLKLFLDNAFYLKEKLGVVLWQFPPGLKRDLPRLEDFCQLLFKSKKDLRYTFEFRHPSWFEEKIYNLLKDHNFSLCIAHSGRWPYVEELTADFVYLRFHGGDVLYGSNYSEKELKEWVARAKGWLKQGRDIYAYFNNDASGFAVNNALRFKYLLSDK